MESQRQYEKIEIKEATDMVIVLEMETDAKLTICQGQRESRSTKGEDKEKRRRTRSARTMEGVENQSKTMTRKWGRDDKNEKKWKRIEG